MTVNTKYGKLWENKESTSYFFDGCVLWFVKLRVSCRKSCCAAGKNPPLGGFYVEMMGFLGAGNNPMVGMTVSVAVAVEESLK